MVAAAPCQIAGVCTSSDKLTGLHNQAADHVINNLLMFNENDEIKVVKSL